MSISQTFRQNAHQQRTLAANTSLANRKAMHERSAATWDAMALSAEETSGRAIVNAAAKAAT